MKNYTSYALFFGFIITVDFIHTADRPLRGVDMSIQEIKQLAAPEKISDLRKLLGRKEIFPQTANAVLYQSFLQHNIDAIIPLLQAGADAEPWMLLQVNEEMEYINGLIAQHGYLSEGSKKNRDKLEDVANEIRRLLRKKRRQFEKRR